RPWPSIVTCWRVKPACRNGRGSGSFVARATRPRSREPPRSPGFRVRRVPRRRVVVDHITVGVSDLTRSRDFYRHALAPLGFAELSRWSDRARAVSFGLAEANDFAISSIYATGAPVHFAFAP